MPSMVDVLVVGPAGRNSGGIAQFIADQRRAFPAGSLRVYDNDVPDGGGAVWFLASLVVSLTRLVVFPFRRRPDVVHVHTSHRFSFYLSSLYALLAVLVWRRPVILHVHGSSFDTFVESLTGVRRWYLSFVLGRCAAVVVLSSYWATALEEFLPCENLVIMPNAVHASRFEPCYREAQAHVVFISNLMPRKGVPELLTAIERLKVDPDVPGFRVTIAGDGPLADEVRALASRFEEVSYVGFVSESRKRELVNDASVFVLPSRAEGLPIALLEGMAGGNAVVSTTVGSIPETIGPEHGRLVPPNDADALTEALRSLVGNPETIRSMGRRNRLRIDEQYSWDVRARQLRELYQSVVDVHGTPPYEEADGTVPGPVADR